MMEIVDTTYPTSKKFKDLSGQKFGMLTVLKFAGRNHSKNIVYLCKCDCGEEKLILGQNLKSGGTTSCGCRLGQRSAHILIEDNPLKGNLYKKLNTSFHSMVYIAKKRNVSICDEWSDLKSGKQNFMEWAISNGCTVSSTLTRTDTSKEFSPENCIWTDHGANNPKTKYISWKFQGKMYTFSAWYWGLITGIPSTAIYKRVFRSNWSVQKALTTPAPDSNSEVHYNFEPYIRFNRPDKFEESIFDDNDELIPEYDFPQDIDRTYPTSPRFIDLSGQVFGKLTVIKYFGKKPKRTFFLCKCECGNTTVVASTCLKKGLTTSCGCVHRKVSSEAATKKWKAFRDEKYQNTYLGIVDPCNNTRRYVFSIEIWSKISGIPCSVIYKRVIRSIRVSTVWSVWNAITTPPEDTKITVNMNPCTFNVEPYLDLNRPELWDECVHA